MTRAVKSRAFAVVVDVLVIASVVLWAARDASGFWLFFDGLIAGVWLAILIRDLGRRT